MNKFKDGLTKKKLMELLDYNPLTGEFTWKVNRGRFARAGNVAGSADKDGYICIGVCGSTYKAHRLAWLYVHGSMPEKQLDHINRIKSDNRIANLRMATTSENRQNMGAPRNNTTGFVGVHYNKQCKKWTASIKINGQVTYLGIYSNIEDAVAARQAAKEKYHPFNPRDIV